MTDIKRVNYYDHQFLHAEDFIDEQKYHLEMRRRHNQNLHTFGIVWGLDVKSESDGTVSVTAGEAIDRNGREMIFAGDRLQLKAAAEGAESYITINYAEVDSDRTEETGGAGFTRKTEKPVVAPADTKPAEPSDFLTLAKLKRTGNAWVVVDPPERSQRAGVALGEDFTVKTLTLKKGNDSSKWPKLSCGDQGSLNVKISTKDQETTVGIGTDTPDRNLTIQGLTKYSNSGTFANLRNNSHEVLLGVDNAAILSAMKKSDLQLRTENINRMVIKADGKVGIGAADPGQQLTVSVLPDQNQPAGPVYANITNGAHELLLGVDAKAVILSATKASDLKISTNNNERVVVTKDGKVGIGSAAPDRNLTISGVAAGPVFANMTNGTHELLLGVDAKAVILSATKASDLKISTNNSERVVVTKDGYVGIGSAAPTRAKLEVNGVVGNTVAIFGGDKKGMSLGVDYPFLGFNCYYKDGFKAISKGRAGYSTLYMNDGSMSFCFDSTGKDVDADAALTPVSGFSIHPNGKLVSPMWKVKQVFTREQGPDGGSEQKGLPSGAFSSGGGTLLFIFSGQAKAGGGGTGVREIVLSLVGPSPKTDQRKMEFKYYSEYAQSHVIFPTCIRLVPGCEKGDYTINLQDVYIDQNDFLDLVVIEFPF
jgi:hypothetical protein